MLRSDSIFSLLGICWAVAVMAWGAGTAQAGAEGGRKPGPKRFFSVGVEMMWRDGSRPLRLGSELGTGEEEGSRLSKRGKEATRNGKGGVSKLAGGHGGLSLTRADFLISGLALRREDGTWLESKDWYGCFLASASGRNRALLEGVPGQVYTAVRFVVGVGETVDQGDPHRWPAGHALNPLVNGLHWGWQGGYIHLALEGHYPRRDDGDGGFSYHLAGGAQRAEVMLEGRLDLTAGGTVGLVFDAAAALRGIEPEQFGESTHSRRGDVRADRLRAQAVAAFRLEGVMPEIWQDLPAAAAGAAASTDRKKLPDTPWPLRISSRFPKVALPADNPLTVGGVALGRRLFHETALSVTGTQSCASCHDRKAAFTDPAGGRFSTGAEGQEGTRNAMPLFNLAWQREFFWDGRSDRLSRQVLEPIQDPVEMHLPLDEAARRLAGKPEYAEEFARVFGSGAQSGPDGKKAEDSPVTPERMGLALEQFLLTLTSQDSRFDRALAGRETLTAQERRGLELFVTEHDPSRNLRGADCFHCHGGALFSNQGFANNGLDPVPAAGRAAVTGEGADRGKFRVPSLRNIAVTAPYMHDGRFRTLEEVVAHYDHGVRRSATLDPNLAKHPDTGLGLTAEDKAALVAFLRTLTDESLIRPDEKLSRPVTAGNHPNP